jgi:hypothetical protein
VSGANNYTSSRPLSNRPSKVGLRSTSRTNLASGTNNNNNSYTKSKYESRISKDRPSSYSRKDEGYSSTVRSRSPLTGGASRSYANEVIFNTKLTF